VIRTAGVGASCGRAFGWDGRLTARGGIQGGLGVGKVLGPGGNRAGMALPIFRALQDGGRTGANRAMESILTGFKHGLLLTGSRDVDQLRSRPKVISGKLKDWLAAL